MNRRTTESPFPNTPFHDDHGYPPTYFNPRTSPHGPGRWHPRLTGYRLITIVLTAGVGLSKAALAYRGLSTAPTTLEWLYGVVVFLALYWLGLYDKYSSIEIPWLFERNYLRIPCGSS